jgi:hypothetical protein
MTRWILRLLCFVVFSIALIMLTTHLSRGIPETKKEMIKTPTNRMKSVVEDPIDKVHQPSFKSCAVPTSKPLNASFGNGRLMAQEAIRRHLGAEKDKRTCCNAQSFLHEFKVNGMEWGVEKPELVDLLRDEVKQWTWINQLKLKNVIKTYELKQECAIACPP